MQDVLAGVDNKAKPYTPESKDSPGTETREK